MKDFRGNRKYVLYCGIITGKKFEEIYQEISNSINKLPVASTILPITGHAGARIYSTRQEQPNPNEPPITVEDMDSPLIEAWIYYEVPAAQIKEPEKAKIKLDLG